VTSLSTGLTDSCLGARRPFHHFHAVLCSVYAILYTKMLPFANAVTYAVPECHGFVILDCVILDRVILDCVILDSVILDLVFLNSGRLAVVVNGLVMFL
jgi:hypothetical protein